MTFERTKNLALLILPFMLAISFTFVLQFVVLSDQAGVQKWLEAFGPWFIVVYTLVQAITIIIAPLGGLFAQLAAISILGPLNGAILIYIVSTPVYCVNFLLARRFGRPLVLKVIGKNGMAKLDDVFTDAGLGTLTLLKVLEGGYFDYVSYAAGLSKITFKQFLVVNFLGGIPYSIISFVIFTKANNLIQSFLILQVVAFILIGLSIAIKHYRHKNPGN